MYSMEKTFFTMMLVCGISISASASAKNNVTIYGIVDVGINHVNHGRTSITKMDSGILNGSRIGFRGSEDLGGGLSANFMLESGYSVDDGKLRQHGRLWGRRSWVGLSDEWGTIRLGRQTNPMHTALGHIDPFGAGLAGDITNFFNAYGTRSDNMVTYLTPTVSGFSGQIGYGLGEVSGSTSAGHLLAGLVGYKSGSVKIQLAYHKQNIVNTDIERGNDKTTMLGGIYDFYIAKLHLAYAVNEGDRLGMTATDSRDMMVGMSIPIGAGTIIGSFLKKKSRIETKATSDLLALGYTYALSKRTTLYSSYGHNRNHDGGTIGPDALVIDPDDSASSFDLGIQHRF